MTLEEEFALGELVLPSNVIYSPLAGCSDYPFRAISSRYGPGLVFCEMVKMEALARQDPNTFHILDFDSSMHPIGGQIVGSRVDLAASSARIIEDLGFDVVDLNCGCPVDKVTRDGSGSGLLKTPDLIGEILCRMVEAVQIPVTVKIRVGWDQNSIVGPQVVKIAEQAGAKAIFVHGRTRKQAYKGPADWNLIRECVEAKTNIKVIGNGDVFDAPAAFRMFEETGCDGVLVSRGTMGQPWIADDIYRMGRGEEVAERSWEECLSVMREHFDLILGYSNPRKAILDMRRVGCWYVKKGAQARAFRSAMSKVGSFDDVQQVLESLAA